METEIILEFSEEQQCFHYNRIMDNVPNNTENNLGWQTLIICKDTNEASAIVGFLKEQFLENLDKKGISKFEELKFAVNSLNKYKENIIGDLENSKTPKKSKFVKIEAIEGSIIVAPKELKALKKHGIDLSILLKKIQIEIYGKISKHWPKISK